MLQPTSLTGSLLMLALTALLWGFWATTKMADRKWRFELYAFDFGFGALLTALVVAMTIGNIGSANSFTFEDNLMVSSKKNMALGLAGGAAFCIGNLMILAGVTLAGMSTALLAGASTALVMAVIAGTIGSSPNNWGLVLGGLAATLAALTAAALAQGAAAKATPVKKGLHPGTKAMIFSGIGGLLTGFGLPLVEYSRSGDIGLGSFGASVFMTAGIVVMTPLVTLYFLNLLVQGLAGSPMEYLSGTAKQHLLGLSGGVMWALGLVLFFSTAEARYVGTPRLVGLEALAYAGGVLGALYGLTAGGDLAGAPKAKQLLWVALGLLGLGIGLTFLGA